MDPFVLDTLKTMLSDVEQSITVPASNSLKTNGSILKSICSQLKLPVDGLSDLTLMNLLTEIALLDSNNFSKNIGMGEREGRILSNLVFQRHYGLIHGIGRSGSISEVQPKAAGSSMLAKLTNRLLLHFIHLCGVKSVKYCLLFPMATGMTISFVLSFLKSKNPSKKYVIWPRIDQKSAFKAILTAGLVPIVVENLLNGDILATDLYRIREEINARGPENVLCVLSTSSCFAPRGCDNLYEISKICSEFSIEHVVNNAYGMHSEIAIGQIQKSLNIFPQLLVVQSTDKNLLVPVGAAFVFGRDKNLLNELAQFYPGRASISHVTDVFLTLLSCGSSKILQLRQDRLEYFKYFKNEIHRMSLKYPGKLRLLEIDSNDISIGIAIFSKEADIGSKLFHRMVSGCRFIQIKSPSKNISGCEFENYGASCNEYHSNYLTVAIAFGVTKEEMEKFIIRFQKILIECS